MVQMWQKAKYEVLQVPGRISPKSTVIQNELHHWIFGNTSLIMFGSLVDLSQSIGDF